MKASLTITGMEVELSVPAGPLETIVADRYAPFLGATQHPVCSLRIEDAMRLTGSHAGDALVAEREAGATFRVTHRSFRGVFDLEGPGGIECAADPQGLDVALRSLFAILGPRHAALLLKGSAVIGGNETQVFAGPVGARAPFLLDPGRRRPLFSGGYVMVRRMPDGAWWAGSTPFGAGSGRPGPPREARLARLWSLSANAAADARTLMFGGATMDLQQHAVLASADPETVQRIRDIALDLMAVVPLVEVPCGFTVLTWDEMAALDARAATTTTDAQKCSARRLFELGCAPRPTPAKVT